MEQGELSVTTWPGYAVPVPDLLHYPDATLDGETIWLGETSWLADWRGHMAPPPAELYLRQARQVDLLDPQALLHFTQSVGGVPAALEDRDLFPATKEARARFAVNRDRLYHEPRYEPDRGFGVHLDEVAYRLRVLEILGRHAVAYREGDYLVPVWQEAYDGHRVRTEEDAWRAFGYHANAALAPFHARVRVIVAGDEARAIGDGACTFLEAGVLQIINDLADEVDYLTCPNCARVFARQVGASTHYSRRAGVTYCSPACGSNARVKAYRARKRAAKTNGQHPEA